jgi:hypothetical protein
MEQSFQWDRKNWGPMSQQVWHDKDPSLLKKPWVPSLHFTDVSIWVQSEKQIWKEILNQPLWDSLIFKNDETLIFYIMVVMIKTNIVLTAYII